MYKRNEKNMYRKKMTHETIVKEANEEKKNDMHPKKKTERNRLQNNGKIQTKRMWKQVKKTNNEQQDATQKLHKHIQIGL